MANGISLNTEIPQASYQVKFDLAYSDDRPFFIPLERIAKTLRDLGTDKLNRRPELRSPIGGY